MTQDHPTPPPPSRPGRSESWRHERMVQRVPAHLGEATGDVVSPWVMVAGVALLVLIVCAVLFVLLGGGTRLGIGGAAATLTPTRTQTPAIIILPVTLPAPPSSTPGPTAASIKYKIKSGDTLIAIAAKYKVSVQSIMTANGLKDDNIRVGDELTIPLPTPTPPNTIPSAPSGATPTPVSLLSAPLSASPASTAGVIRYVVKRGDTLSSVASSFGSSIDAIRAANQLDNDLLSVGQELQVPMGSWTATPTPVPTSNATATPTSQFAYAAPSLVLPPDKAIFHGKQDIPMLTWTSPATLKPNEYYIVHIDYQFNGANKSIVQPFNQGNSFRLDASKYYPGASSNGTVFSWYVVVVNQTKGNSQVFASSPASPSWTFVWY